MVHYTNKFRPGMHAVICHRLMLTKYFTRGATLSYCTSTFLQKIGQTPLLSTKCFNLALILPFTSPEPNFITQNS